MNVLPLGERLIVKSEGYTPYVYADPNGDATAGPGKFLHKGPPTQADIRKYGTKSNPGMSRREYFAMLDDLIDDFEKGVRAILRESKIAVNRCEFSALVCIAYNIGLGGLRGSSIIKRLRRNQRFLAGVAFTFWIFGEGMIRLPGLVIRRNRERRLFRRKSSGCGLRRIP